MLAELPDDLGLLLALDVLLRERHVTRAARRLGITQGAASQKLARLRDFFRDPLLVPGRPLLVPTPRAQAIERPLAHALAALRAAVHAGAPFDAATSDRRFVILGNDLVETYALPPILAALSRDAPHVTVSVERVEQDFADRLEKGTADAAFVPTLPALMVGESLRRRALPPERFVVLLRKGHPLARKKLDLRRYLELGHVLVAPRGMPGSIVDAALEKKGLRRRVVARVQHFVSAPHIVASSDLAVTCPATVFDATARWLPIVALDAPLELPTDQANIVWHARAHEDPGHVWLRAQLDALLREQKRQPPRERPSPKARRLR